MLLTPAISELNKIIRDKVETTFICRKHKELFGAKAKSYVVAQYSKCSIRGKPVKTDVKTYDPRFFTFYKSYAGDKSGSEELVDARQHVFSKDFFVKKGLLIFALVLIGGILAVRWYSKTTSSAATLSPKTSSPSGTAQSPGADKPASAAAVPPKPVLADSKRIVSVVVGKSHTFVYIDSGGRIDTLIDPSSLAFIGQHASVLFDGERITDAWGKPLKAESMKSPL